MTGLTEAQLRELAGRVRRLVGGPTTGRLHRLGLAESVCLVVFLLRENVTQAVAAAVFGVSQPTVSRRFEQLRDAVTAALAEWVPDPAAATRGDTVLVDGTLALTWDWRHRDDLFSGKHRDSGFNLQVAATLDGQLLAVGEPVPGKRHDAYAYAASGLAGTLAGIDVLADLGYVGLGVRTGIKKPPGRDLTESEKETNSTLSAIRAAVEQVIAHLKNWKILGARCRAPLSAQLTSAAVLVRQRFTCSRPRSSSRAIAAAAGGVRSSPSAVPSGAGPSWNQASGMTVTGRL